MILLEDISDHPENFTRFVAIAAGRCGRSCPACQLAHGAAGGHGPRPGALHEAIEPFRYHGVNMVSLHSRPIPGEPWRYQFSLDIDGHRDEETVSRALDDVRAPRAPLVTLGHLPDDGAAG